MNFKAVILTVGMALAATQAVAGPTCHEPHEKWIDAKQFQSKLEQEGYKIKKFKVTSGECYEIYGTNPKGERVEIYFNPASGEAIKTKHG